MNGYEYYRHHRPYAGRHAEPEPGYYGAYPFFGYSPYGYEPGRWTGAAGGENVVTTTAGEGRKAISGLTNGSMA